MMSRRFSTAEKGKGIAQSSTDTTRKRIRAPDFDYSELVRDNSKTLIGRLLNPREQRAEDIVLELPKKWALRGRVVGATLGNNCFQFRFDRDEDLQCVLLNRPYHHNNWMVVLERWEPVISNTFPSKIPFWITVRGLPLHFWHKKMVDNIAFELGQLEDSEITKTSARIRILLDTLEPLTMDSIVDFSTGEEVPITFEYEGIASSCSRCNMLTHSTRYCTRRMQDQHGHDQGIQRTSDSNRGMTVGRLNSSQKERITANSLDVDHTIRGTESFYQRVDRHGRPFGDRVTSEVSRVRPLKNKITPDSDNRPPPIRAQDLLPANQGRRPMTDRLRPPNPPQLQWRAREKQNTPPLPPLPPRLLDTVEKTPTPTLGRNLHESDFSKHIVPTNEEVLEELREVTLQYIHCPDPVESAARRRRVIQGEEKNLMANTASNIIAAATASAVHNANAVQTGSQIILLPDSEIVHADTGAVPPGRKMPTGAKTTATTGTKRRGRPPGPTKKQTTSKIMGGSAKKRIFSKIQASPARQSGTPSSAMRGRTNATLSANIHNVAAPASAPNVITSTPGFHIPGSPLP